MNRFLQLHLLTSYPPANLNRDDLGRPKTAKMGGSDRLRVSSQSLKRAWRTSDLFQSALAGHIGCRTKMLGTEVYALLRDQGVDEKKAKAWAKKIAEQFGKLKPAKKEDKKAVKQEDADQQDDKDKPNQGLEIEQLVHISASESQLIKALVAKLAAENRDPNTDELELLRSEGMSVDIALFGRMLASKPKYNVEAACQVAHSISVHAVVIEDDYFTAVDDLNKGDEDAGAAHIGETSFAAGLFYSYVCINKELLLQNLNNNQALATKTLAALIEVATKVAPQGKQNSFASRAYASYVLAELGKQQPRSLAVAFLKPVARHADDFANEAVKAIRSQRENFDKVYGKCADSHHEIDVLTGTGSLCDLVDFSCDFS